VSTLPIIAGREIVDRLTTSRKEELEDERSALEGKLDDARAFSDPNRQLLMYDPRGDGRVAEVFGELEHANHATVMVPGIGNSMDGFDGEFRGEVQNFHNESDARSGGEAATVAWLGYDSPDGFTDPATFENDNAADGGESLARSVDGINAQNPGAHTTVAGHSYGSVVTGNAAAHHGLMADDVVLTGSPGPGPGVDHASDLSRGGEARVWSAAAPDDLVASPPTVPDPADIPGSLDDQIRELNHVHGPSPATPEFGARRFDTPPVRRSAHLHQGRGSAGLQARLPDRKHRECDRSRARRRESPLSDRAAHHGLFRSADACIPQSGEHRDRRQGVRSSPRPSL